MILTLLHARSCQDRFGLKLVGSRFHCAELRCLFIQQVFNEDIIRLISTG